MSHSWHLHSLSLITHHWCTKKKVGYFARKDGGCYCPVVRVIFISFYETVQCSMPVVLGHSNRWKLKLQFTILMCQVNTEMAMKTVWRSHPSQFVETLLLQLNRSAQCCDIAQSSVVQQLSAHNNHFQHLSFSQL